MLFLVLYFKENYTLNFAETKGNSIKEILSVLHTCKKRKEKCSQVLEHGR